MQNQDQYFMKKVLELATVMLKDDENVEIGVWQQSLDVPVAAIVVNEQDEILGIGLNTREREHSVIGHAEINAIQAANKTLGDWNLSNCRIYVSLEPCPMCAGAILQSHMKEVIFAAYDLKSGAFGSRYNITNKNLVVRGGVMEDAAKEILGEFFRKLREV